MIEINFCIIVEFRIELVASMKLKFHFEFFSSVSYEYKNIARLLLFEMAMISNFPVLGNPKVKMD